MNIGDAVAVSRSGPIGEQRRETQLIEEALEEVLAQVRAQCAEEDGQIETQRGLQHKKKRSTAS